MKKALSSDYHRFSANPRCILARATFECSMLKRVTIAERVDPRWKVCRLLPALALCLTGCSASDDPNMWYNKTVVENLSGRSDSPPSTPPAYGAGVPAPSAVPSAAANQPLPGAATAVATYPAAGAAAAPRALPESEFYRSEASCGGIILGSGLPPSVAASQGVGLGMTECEVARRLGAPDRMELASAAGDQRLLTLTYGRGEHPRLYRFALDVFTLSKRFRRLPHLHEGQHRRADGESISFPRTHPQSYYPGFP
jgi:hypothetical protein